MNTNLVPLVDVAAELGVSRRRAQAMVESGVLVAERIGSQWLVPIESVHQARNLRRAKGGRPLSAGSAWKQIVDHPDRLDDLTIDHLDTFRRRVRSRAEHSALFVHPSVVSNLRLDHPDTVLGGRDAAAAWGVPVDPTVLDVYVRPDLAVTLAEKYRPVIDPVRANLQLHVVQGPAWPFEPGQQFADPWTAWLDLEDRQDRAAFTLLDRLVGGRLLA